MALTSPSEPPMWPRKMSHSDGMSGAESTSLRLCPFFTPSLIRPRGVAPLTVSRLMGNHLPTVGHVVICTGKEMSINTRPTRAGLKGFLPNPPKVILPTPIATRAPMATIHIISAVAGTLKASSRPVTMAEPSHTVEGTFMMNFSISHWNRQQQATDTMLMSKAFRPKYAMPVSSMGTKARLTRHMIFLVDSSLWTCGEPDIFNRFIS